LIPSRPKAAREAIKKAAVIVARVHLLAWHLRGLAVSVDASCERTVMFPGNNTFGLGDGMTAANELTESDRVKLRIRYTRQTIFEAEVQVPSGPRDEMLERGMIIADDHDLWIEIEREAIKQEIVSEERLV
jgi:hypothetical protein